MGWIGLIVLLFDDLEPDLLLVPRSRGSSYFFTGLIFTQASLGLGGGVMEVLMGTGFLLSYRVLAMSFESTLWKESTYLMIELAYELKVYFNQLIYSVILVQIILTKLSIQTRRYYPSLMMKLLGLLVSMYYSWSEIYYSLRILSYPSLIFDMFSMYKSFFARISFIFKVSFNLFFLRDRPVSS